MGILPLLLLIICLIGVLVSSWKCVEWSYIPAAFSAGATAFMLWFMVEYLAYDGAKNEGICLFAACLLGCISLTVWHYRSAKKSNDANRKRTQPHFHQ